MTSQQQLTAFLTHCTVLRQGHVFSFKKKKSSLRHFVAELEQQIATGKVRGLMQEGHEGALTALQLNSPKDHVKYLPAIRSLTAVWGTDRTYVRLAAPMLPISTLYWDVVTGDLSTVPGKISISSRYPGYHLAVATHLTALSKTEPGDTLLTALANSAGHTTSIVDHPLSNQCGAQGSTNGMNAVAKELFTMEETKLGPATKAALNKAPKLSGSSAKWLARQINAIPRYKLKGVPSTAPSNLGVTEAQVLKWVAGNSIWDDFGNDPDLEQIKNAIIVALYPYATAGTGCSSLVNYSLGSANPLNVERPPAIGLAHELVHAYYNLLGMQPGFEVENPTTVLFEYLCVGLGPWDGEDISENAIRADWNTALTHFDDDDTRNLVGVVARPYYSKP